MGVPFDTGDVSLNTRAHCPWISSQQDWAQSFSGVTAVLNSPPAPRLAGGREHKWSSHKGLDWKPEDLAFSTS